MRTILSGISILATILLAVIVFQPAGQVVAADQESGKNSEYLDQARLAAEQARLDAEKAMAEAERAMAEAERAIAEAERNKAKAKVEKVEAMEKMVEHGYFPGDIEMIAPDGSAKAVFSHKKHTQREKLRCIECHPQVFLMKVGKNVVKKGHLSMEDMKKGKYCGNCHNGHKAFNVSDIKSCKRCHPKG